MNMPPPGERGHRAGAGRRRASHRTGTRIRAGRAPTDCGSAPAARHGHASPDGRAGSAPCVLTSVRDSTYEAIKGEDDGLGHRAEQIAGDAAEIEHRHEDDADAQKRDGRRKDDLPRAVHDRAFDVFALFEVVVDVLDRNRRIVDENADREREAAERHHVDRFAGRGQRGDGGENRERNRDRDDERRAPAAEKDQDHQAGQRRRDDAFEDNRIDRRIDERRLIVDGVQLEARGQGLPDLGKQRLDAIDDVKRRRRPRFQDRHQDGVLRRRRGPC